MTMMDLRIGLYALFSFLYLACMTFAIGISPGDYPQLMLHLISCIGLLLFDDDSATLTSLFRYPLAISHLYQVAKDYDRMPEIWEFMFWAIQADTVMAFWLLFGSNNSVNEKNASASQLMRAIRDQYANFYMAAAFWKMNWDFLDPMASCGTMFVMQMYANYVVPILPTSIVVPIAQRLRVIAPISTLLAELSFGVPLMLGAMTQIYKFEKFGVLMVILFHFMVCLVPEPNDISQFGLKCVARLIVFASPTGAKRALEHTKKYSHILAAYVMLIAIGRGVSSKAWSPLNWAFSFYVPVGGFVALAVLCSDADANNATSHKPVKRKMWVLAVSSFACFYAFGSLTLGLQEEHTPNMFGNLKVHGGSNHLIAPTGILFHVFAEAGDGHPFGGGVIRVQETTSAWLKTVYPADLTWKLQPSPSVQDLMAKVGNPAPNFFNPGTNRVLGLVNEVPNPWYRYTVPALEFKRLFQEAKEKDLTFDLTYDVLPGTKGDEVWRALAVIRRFQLEVVNGKVEACTVLTKTQDGGRRECDNQDLPLLPPNSVPWFFRRFTMNHAYPIISQERDQIRKAIQCFGP